MKSITKDIFYTGIFNPNLRVFDVIMKTEYGTSYNSYIVKGSEKTAIIETSHLSFFEAYLENIQEVVDLQNVDYLIMNHNEPDHSGAIARLLEINPDITVLASQAGTIYLKNIINNPGAKIRAVKDGESISLGNKTLTFLIAPFLHWPDSMFTWVEEDKVLFPCDFLGTHYCEPQIMDTRITYPGKYKEAFKGYYDAIFSPFKPYVLKGLDKIKDLDIAFACTSHGPILTKKGLLGEAMEKYREWSKPVIREYKIIPIFYCTAYGNTKLLAKSIQQGIKDVIPSAKVNTFDVIEHDMDTLAAILNESDAFLVGSPTINRDALSPVWVLLSHMESINIVKRPVALFGSMGWSGEAISHLIQRLSSVKANVFEEVLKVVFVPTEEDLQNAVEFGKKFAKTLL